VDSNTTWKVEYEKEIERASLARSAGNEGMARVCARRAAGILIGKYLDRLGYANLSNRAYDRLLFFSNLPELDQKYKDIADHCLTKVNFDHVLPDNADLVSEVRWLAENLLGADKD
jgi:hypothetical protein